MTFYISRAIFEANFRKK